MQMRTSSVIVKPFGLSNHTQPLDWRRADRGFNFQAMVSHNASTTGCMESGPLVYTGADRPNIKSEACTWQHDARD